MDKKKIVIPILIVIAIIILTIGATYSYWTWSSNNTQKTMVTFTSTSKFACSGDGGGNITSADYTLVPTHCTDPNYAIQRTVTTSVTNNSGDNVYYDLWLDVNTIGANLSASNNFKYAITSQANDCTSNVIQSGTFYGLATGDIASLLLGFENVHTTSENNTYYLYIWLDEAETNNNTMTQSFNLSLNGRCTDILYGDINGDGLLDNKDATVLQRYIKYGDVEISSFEAADVNNDGSIGNNDATMLQRYLMYEDVILGPH